jgi:hypothetical protein
MHRRRSIPQRHCQRLNRRKLVRQGKQEVHAGYGNSRADGIERRTSVASLSLGIGRPRKIRTVDRVYDPTERHADIYARRTRVHIVAFKISSTGRGIRDLGVEIGHLRCRSTNKRRAPAKG